MNIEHHTSSIFKQFESALSTRSAGDLKIMEPIPTGVVEVYGMLSKRKISLRFSKSYSSLAKPYPAFKIWRLSILSYVNRNGIMRQSGNPSRVSAFLLADSVSTVLVDIMDKGQIEWNANALILTGRINRKKLDVLHAVISSYLTMIERFEKKV